MRYVSVFFDQKPEIYRSSGADDPDTYFDLHQKEQGWNNGKSQEFFLKLLMARKALSSISAAPTK